MQTRQFFLEICTAPLRQFIARIWIGLIALMSAVIFAPSAQAATCSQAGAQGTAPATWQTYCWIDFADYNDAVARTAAGQNFSITLTDGSILSFNIKVSGPTTTSITAPSWTGAAVGNSAFLSIPGKPILYQTSGGLSTPSTITFSSITVTPPTGASAVTAYAFVAADGESTDNSEGLSFTTNGSGWVLLDSVPPISGSSMPTQSGVGTGTFTEGGGGVTGNTGAYIVGSNSPTTVTTVLTGSGLQGAMFAVRFASLRLNKQIAGGGRVNAADQFKFDVAATGSGSSLASGTSTGTGNGPFTAAAVSLASGIPLTLTESMAAGSISALSEYQSRLTCTNSISGSTTPLPTNVLTTSFDFGTLQFGDAIQCTFTNTPYPHLRLTKALGVGGRQFDSDQFVMNINQGAATVATTTTAGIGAILVTETTPTYQANAGTTYTFAETGAGSTSLLQYTYAMTCTNTFTGSSTVLPTVVGGAITPQVGDVVSCTITNTRKAANASLTLLKSSTILSDSVNGTTNPKSIPRAIMNYSLMVTNTGTATVTNDSIFILDSLPNKLLVGTSSAPTFIQGTPASGLTFTAGTDIRYSDQATAPATFAACSASPHNYTPVAAYDNNVKFICINPKGTMAGSTGTPPNFTITFQAQIK
jgi:hypothetical protein